MTPSGPPSVTNIQQVPALQTLLSDHHIVPTYLLTFPVANDEKAAAVFRQLLEAGQCEIGMHCHPWTSPPHEEVLNRHNSMLCNLPRTLQMEKLRRLHEMIQHRFDRAPVAFRSGRWGFGREAAGILAGLGCHIDSSITPYTSWTGSGGPDFSAYSPHPFTFSRGEFARSDPDGDMVEMPVTIGYVGGSFARCHRLHRRLTRPPFHHLHTAGLLARLEFVRSVWLSPERETAARLIRLLRQSMREGCRIVNLFFHSPSLQVGCTPFVRTLNEKHRLLRTLSTIFEFCRESGIRSVSLSEAAQNMLRGGSLVHSA
ncbi:MAG: glycosyltransferase [Nitrospiraceae bacterium]